MIHTEIGDVNYKIHAKHERALAITVMYWLDGYALGVTKTLPLPLQSTNMIPRKPISGDELVQYIKEHVPVKELEYKHYVFANSPFVDWSEIDALIDSRDLVEIVTPTPPARVEIA